MAEPRPQARCQWNRGGDGADGDRRGHGDGPHGPVSTPLNGQNDREVDEAEQQRVAHSVRNDPAGHGLFVRLGSGEAKGAPVGPGGDCSAARPLPATTVGSGTRHVVGEDVARALYLHMQG